MLPEELDEFEEERRKRRKIKSTTNVCVHVVKKSHDFVYILCALLTLETNKTVFVNEKKKKKLSKEKLSYEN